MLSVALQMLWSSLETNYKLPTEVQGMSHSLAPLCADIFRLKIKILTVTVELQTGMQSKEPWSVLMSGQVTEEFRGT